MHNPDNDSHHVTLQQLRDSDSSRVNDNHHVSVNNQVTMPAETVEKLLEHFSDVGFSAGKQHDVEALYHLDPYGYLKHSSMSHCYQERKVKAHQKQHTTCMSTFCRWKQ